MRIFATELIHLNMKVIEKKTLLPFALITSLFLLWGIANNMTDTLLSAFRRIMSMNDAQTSLIQFAFYGSYFCFALPAALFIRKYSYKMGVVLGLLLYAAGTMLFYPAAQMASYAFYLVAIYIMAGGCSILETTANPYILSMGSPETATRRLNIAQSFNPMGSIIGILLSQNFILAELSSASAEDRALMSQDELAAMQSHELGAVTGTYMVLGVVLIIIMVVMLMSKMPKGSDDSGEKLSLKKSFSTLWDNKRYRWGVIAQFFYIGAQIGVWSFTIRLVMQELNILEAEAANIYLISIVSFCISRFIYTWLMKYFAPASLLQFGAAMSMLCCVLVVALSGMGWAPVICLMLISFFMSLMFPTIYGIALDNVKSEAKIGASGLIMAILGGALITPVQGLMSDAMGISLSYIIPLICFAVVFGYAKMVKN